MIESVVNRQQPSYFSAGHWVWVASGSLVTGQVFEVTQQITAELDPNLVH